MSSLYRVSMELVRSCRERDGKVAVLYWTGVLAQLLGRDAWNVSVIIPPCVAAWSELFWALAI